MKAVGKVRFPHSEHPLVAFETGTCKSKDTLSVSIMKGSDMAVITPEIKEFIKNNLGWITTVSKDGELDPARRCPLFVLDDTHIALPRAHRRPALREPQERFPAGHRFANLEKK